MLKTCASQYTCSTYLPQTGRGVMEIGKAVSILLCHELAHRAVEKHEADTALVDSEFGFTGVY